MEPWKILTSDCSCSSFLAFHNWNLAESLAPREKSPARDGYSRNFVQKKWEIHNTGHHLHIQKRMINTIIMITIYHSGG